MPTGKGSLLLPPLLSLDTLLMGESHLTVTVAGIYSPPSAGY